MNKIYEGRSQTTVTLDDFSFSINGSDYHLEASKSAKFYVSFYFEAAIRATEDEPGCDEYLEPLIVRPESIIYLTNNNGIAMSIDPRADILKYLTEKDIDVIIKAIKEQAEGYSDNDLRRPPVNSRMLRELGHEFNDDDWSHK